MRVVVTGGSGKIGGYVVRDLVGAGHTVLNADTKPPKEPVPGVTFVQADTADFGQTLGVLAWRGEIADAVIHLAAIPNVWPQNPAPATEVWRVNALSVYHVAEACATLGIGRFVETSSVNVHQYMLTRGAVPPPGWPLNERTPPYVLSAYGLSKVAGEATAQMLHARTGAQAISLRPTDVTAPDEYAARIARMRDTAQPRYLWAYTDIRDLATAYRLSVEKTGLGCEALYIANDDALADRPIEECIRAAYPTVPESAIGVRGTQSDISSAKAKRLLGWQPVHSWRTED